MSGVKNESKYQTETKAFDQTRDAQPVMASLFDSNPANAFTMDAIFLTPLSISSSVPKPSKPPASPCESVPFYVSRSNSISTKLDDFTKVRQEVGTVLDGIEDLCSSYIGDTQSFFCKFSNGSSSREYQVSCFWDRDAQEHIIDVKKLCGDGFYRFRDISAALRSKFAAEGSQNLSSGLKPSLGSRPSLSDFRSVPSSLLDEVDGILDAPLSVLRSDLFRDGIERLLAMMKCDYYEGRVQGVKGICDVAASGEKINLCSALCVQMLVEALSASLRGSGEVVSEFTVNALEILSLESEYLAAFSQSKDLLRDLLDIIRNLSPEESYLFSHMMRRSATVLSRVAIAFPREALDTLKQNGIATVDAWNQRLASYTDDVVRKNLEGVANAFKVTDATMGALKDGVSPCDEKPSTIGMDHFYTNHAEYLELEAKLRSAFDLMDADTPSSYFSDSQCFKFKTQEGSSVILGHVNTFYDSDLGDHVVEVRRVAGEVNFSSSMRDVSESLQIFLKSGELPPLQPRARPNSTLETISQEADSIQTMVDSVKSMVSFVNDQYVENRIEGLKMLIDLVLAQVQLGRNVVEDAACVAIVVGALRQRIKDSHFEVQEFAVIAIDAFCCFNSYKKAFVSEDSGVVSSLWNIVQKTSLAPCDKYQNAIKVRKAAAVVFSLSSYDADAIRRQVPSLSTKSDEAVNSFATIDKNVYSLLQRTNQNIINSVELSSQTEH